ncbi:MAG: purine-nucleoside phosphorylase [Planctomyces sp.]
MSIALSQHTTTPADWQPAAQQTLRLAGLPDSWRADVGIVLGSGLGAAAEHIAEGDSCELRMGEIPGLAAPHVAGHRGRWLFARCGRHRVIVQQGRIHSYEGHSTAAITAHIRLMVALGIRTLILTNAAGGIRRDFRPGDFMAIIDHLRAPHAGFPAWSETVAADCVRMQSGPQRGPGPWEPGLIRTLLSVPTSLHIHQGVYAMMPGPAYETPAEVRMLQTLGADAVGMSTIPEALTAADCGVQVLGLSCITNIACGLSSSPLSHAEVTATALTVESQLGTLLRDFLHRL